MTTKVTKLLSAILKKIWAIDVLSYDHERRYKPEALSLRVLEPILRNGMKISMTSLRS
jgi:hypothetical protein